jgi:hypothetical protein
MNPYWWVVLFLAVNCTNFGASSRAFPTEASGIIYTNIRVASEPWSIHVVKIERGNSKLEIHSAHADGRAVGLSTITAQLKSLPPSLGKPVAAINGDFYQRDSTFAGDPRGLQIVEGDILSSPVGGASFWIDAIGEPHTDNVNSDFQVIWPDGSSMPLSVNGEAKGNRAELYTEAFGSMPPTGNGTELALQPDARNSLSPLRIGRIYSASVQQIRSADDRKVPEGGAILYIPGKQSGRIPKLEAGAKVRISTLCTPTLKGIKTAISGGPVLLRDGKRVKLPKAASDSFQYTSMFERHPRTAIGWNSKYYFFVEVDGRQKRLSAGMTLDELTGLLEELGCENGMNLDGGGSATLWCLGKVRNSPCDGRERELANSLVAVWKEELENGAKDN